LNRSSRRPLAAGATAESQDDLPHNRDNIPTLFGNPYDFPAAFVAQPSSEIAPNKPTDGPGF
jgi:hypothetical protein